MGNVLHSNSAENLQSVPLSSEQLPIIQTSTLSSVTSLETDDDKDQHLNKRVSIKIVGIAAQFWNSMISTLSAEDELVSLYFGSVDYGNLTNLYQ